MQDFEHSISSPLLQERIGANYNANYDEVTFAVSGESLKADIGPQTWTLTLEGLEAPSGRFLPA